MAISIIKPSWVVHPDETRTDLRPTTIYTLSIHPDRSRLATGGLDTKIRLWSTLGVVDERVERDERCPKLLSTLLSHSVKVLIGKAVLVRVQGVVMCVRWSHDGRYLASGSDDKIVMIWSLEQGKGGKVWGTDQVNIENWKAVRRLVGHDSDVAGVAWSPNDEYVASVGLDSSAYVYSGKTFERIARLDGHMGFVKGLVFDPVGQYLATQSDDGSAKIWRTSDWRLHTSIEDVFVQAPKTNINRPSWSPDGSHLVLPNATSNDVFVAAVIERSTFRGQTFMVGHGNIVECSAFNPHVFLRDPKLPAESNNFCSVLALCARSTLSLWITSKSEPVIVFEQIFERDILDLSWSKDGQQLWACSSEGHVAVFEFDLDEIATVCPVEAKEKFWTDLYGTNVPALKGAAAVLEAQKLMAVDSFVPMRNGTMLHGIGATTTTSVNTLVARKGPGAKRVVPRAQQIGQVQVGGNPFASAPVMQAPLGAHQMMMQQPATLPMVQQVPQRAVLQNGMQTIAQTWPQQQQQVHQPIGFPHPQEQNPAAYTYVVPNQLQPHYTSHAPSSSSFPNQGQGSARRSLEAMEIDHVERGRPLPGQGYGDHLRLSEAEYRTQGRTVGGGRSAVERQELRELRPAYAPVVGAQARSLTFGISNRPDGKGERALAIPAVKTFGEQRITEQGDRLQVRNFGEGERKGSSEVCVVLSASCENGKEQDAQEKTLWIDYHPSFIVSSTGSPLFSAVSLEDESLVVYSPAGRRLWPVVVLDSPCAFLCAEGKWLMVVTAKGTLGVWDVPRRKVGLEMRSIEALLTSGVDAEGAGRKGTTSTTITTAALLPNGTPVVALSSGVTCSFDRALGVWVRVGEKGWKNGSELWGCITEEDEVDGAVGRVETAIREAAGADTSEAEGDEDDEEGKSPIAPDSDVERSSKKRKLSPTLSGDPSAPQGEQNDFGLSRTLAHAEARIEASVALDSPQEYSLFMRRYCERLGKAGILGRVEEVIRSLLGPVYYQPSSSETKWDPKVLSFNKRDILREVVLPELSKHETCKKLVEEYGALLKKIEG
ncbi:BZ3500_MvSof-1268-A1-R1_Chr2-1g04093 [Microbotryum saponariae]|uniref:Protein HIR n=1 Tax=Microbotryum saponariae TaxID=289078 RepID=A0A2X0MAE7_9BASI|nr:BZ3500_MvSof-1268-A1-R1_Chr2-1g04093 [Microbotryum saponariae]SCZ91080.1 BZ3501_MvSof-1269-A2-R1_Chr2-1g03749 [Microbotryum saponariae]